MGDNNIPMMSTLDVGDKVVIGLGVEDVGAEMQRFGWPDYVMFVVMLLICISIGLYYALFKSPLNAQEYLVGGRTMKVIPIGFSLVASYISGISLLGIPTEIYVYGIQYMYIIGGFLLMTIVMGSIYLPVFQGLQLTSTYEYHERRFDKKVRLFGSLLFTFGILSWLPLVIYVPALAFNQVTGINVHLITPIVCVICIFYTSMVITKNMRESNFCHRLKHTDVSVRRRKENTTKMQDITYLKRPQAQRMIAMIDHFANICDPASR